MTRRWTDTRKWLFAFNLLLNVIKYFVANVCHTQRLLRRLWNGREIAFVNLPGRVL